MRNVFNLMCCHLCLHLYCTLHISTLWTVSALGWFICRLLEITSTVFVFRQTPIPIDAWRVSQDHVAHKIDRGALYFCGFPTLQHIRHKVNHLQSDCLQIVAYYPINGIIGLMPIFLLYLSHSFIRRKVEWWCFNKAAEGRTWYWRF